MVVGHEVSAVISKLSQEVTTLKVGQYILMSDSPWCWVMSLVLRSARGSGGHHTQSGSVHIDE